jgi:phosphoribosylformylglycinamidine synthase
MATVVVDVMPKQEILDPQGQAVVGALRRLGIEQFSDVRQGKRFTLEVEGEITEDVLEAAREAADTLLSNPVIEEVVSVRAQQDIDSVRAQQDIDSVRAQQEPPA